jgi:hypothetical protein
MEHTPDSLSCAIDLVIAELLDFITNFSDDIFDSSSLEMKLTEEEVVMMAVLLIRQAMQDTTGQQINDLLLLAREGEFDLTEEEDLM